MTHSRVMNPGLQKYGIESYLGKRIIDFDPEKIDLPMLIDSSLALSENCENVLRQVTDYECDL